MFRKAVALLLALALLLPVGSALAVKYYRVNTTWLKAHEKPDYDAKVVDSYRRDFAVTIARMGRDGWAKVRFRPGGAAVFVQDRADFIVHAVPPWLPGAGLRPHRRVLPRCMCAARNSAP